MKQNTILEDGLMTKMVNFNSIIYCLTLLILIHKM